jgi:hypothetical protein
VSAPISTDVECKVNYPVIVQPDLEWCVSSPSFVSAEVLVTAHCTLYSALKEVFEPPRMNNSRTDFSAVCRSESDKFD